MGANEEYEEEDKKIATQQDGRAPQIWLRTPPFPCSRILGPLLVPHMSPYSSSWSMRVQRGGRMLTFINRSHSEVGTEE